MKLSSLFGKREPAREALPSFIRKVEDLRGVRVLRLQGDVGKGIGAEVEARFEDLEREGEPFQRPLLLDFAAATGADFSTVAYLVESLRKRMESWAKVAIINPSPELVSELEIAKLESLFGVFESEEEALARLGSGA